MVIENSFDPARDVLNVIRETGVDLVVMRARAGVFAAPRFGSVVERVVGGCDRPVLLLPPQFLAGKEQRGDLRRILFASDRSEGASDLAEVAAEMAEAYGSELEFLAEPERVGGRSRTAVDWRARSSAVLASAATEDADLICTALETPSTCLDKLYREYIGELLRSSGCPILVKQAAKSVKCTIPARELVLENEFTDRI